jgi:hypothetical protein
LRPSIIEKNQGEIGLLPARGDRDRALLGRNADLSAGPAWLVWAIVALTGRTPLDYRLDTHMQTFFFAYQRPA